MDHKPSSDRGGILTRTPAHDPAPRNTSPPTRRPGASWVQGPTRAHAPPTARSRTCTQQRLPYLSAVHCSCILRTSSCRRAILHVDSWVAIQVGFSWPAHTVCTHPPGGDQLSSTLPCTRLHSRSTCARAQLDHSNARTVWVFSLPAPGVHSTVAHFKFGIELGSRLTL